jgi:ABC-type spermidine/putrescine transport system permease subunit II
MSKNKKELLGEKSIEFLDATRCILLIPTIILGISIMAGDSLQITIGFAVCFLGVTVFALCGVLNSLAQNLVEIRKNTEKK